MVSADLTLDCCGHCRHYRSPAGHETGAVTFRPDDCPTITRIPSNRGVVRLRSAIRVNPSTASYSRFAFAFRLSSGQCYDWWLPYSICREAIPMTSMRRDDLIWIAVVTLIAVTINPILKSIGLLPADVFRGLGISFPGQPQIVFGPLMAFLL